MTQVARLKRKYFQVPDTILPILTFSAITIYLLKMPSGFERIKNPLLHAVIMRKGKKTLILRSGN